MSTEDENMVDTEHTAPCPICHSFPHKLTCPNGEGVIKIPVTVGPEFYRE